MFCVVAVNNIFTAKISRFEVCSCLFIKKAWARRYKVKLIYNYLPVFLFPLHLQIYWYSTADTPPTLASPRNELLTGSNPFSWSCEKAATAKQTGQVNLFWLELRSYATRPNNTTWHYRMKIFLPNENTPLNGNIFYRMKTLYQMEIIFIEWKYFFIKWKYILSNGNIFLSNENNFYRMQIYFYRMKTIFIEFCYISATIPGEALQYQSQSKLTGWRMDRRV